MTSRTVRRRFATLPSSFASFPRLVLTRRPDVLAVAEDTTALEACVDGVQVDRVQADRYAIACGYDTSSAGRPLPLTYPHVLAMPLHLQVMAAPEFPLRPMGLIHVSNSIEAHAPVRADSPVDLVVAARRYRKTDAGLAFDMDTELRQDGAVAWRETCGFLSRWPESVQRASARPTRPPKAPKDAVVLEELVVTLDTAWSYARVSGDFNPIHLHERAARFFGLRGAIVHGMWSLARSLATSPAPACEAGGRLDTQFLTPVQLPARVAIKAWTEDGIAKRAMCDVRTGRVHMQAAWTATSSPAVRSPPASRR